MTPLGARECSSASRESESRRWGTYDGTAGGVCVGGHSSRLLLLLRRRRGRRLQALE